MIQELATQVLGSVAKDPDLTYDEVADASRMYLALRSIVQSNKLDGIAVRCCPELWELGKPVCFAMSRLEDEGVEASCESDLSMAVTQIMMCSLADSNLNVDIGSLNVQDNTAFLFHCGAGPTRLAAESE